VLEAWEHIKTNVTCLQEIMEDYLSLACLTGLQRQPARAYRSGGYAA
jgi:hypothetical protein